MERDKREKKEGSITATRFSTGHMQRERHTYKDARKGKKYKKEQEEKRGNTQN